MNSLAKVNDHSRDWGLMLEHDKTFHTKPEIIVRLKKVFLVDMGPSAARLNQQDDTQITERFRACMKAGVNSLTYFEKKTH